MAIDYYSKVRVQPSDRSGIEISVDIPLRLLTGSERRQRTDGTEGLLRPLQIAAESALEYIDKRGQGLKLNVQCEIPIGAGLGSSASTTVATISAVAASQGRVLNKKEIFKLAFFPENFLHGTPSGVDQATCIYGGTLQFKRPSTIKPIILERHPTLLLCDTGIHHATRTLVGSVVKKSKTDEKDFQKHLDQSRAISEGMVKALKAGDDDEMGRLMSDNHEILKKIGVSHPKLDQLVIAARRAGALGAKLTGAGGGGCILAVCRNSKQREAIARRLRTIGGIPYNVTQDPHGLTVTRGRALK